jgi:hypothetical protein
MSLLQKYNVKIVNFVRNSKENVDKGLHARTSKELFVGWVSFVM